MASYISRKAPVVAAAVYVSLLSATALAQTGVSEPQVNPQEEPATAEDVRADGDQFLDTLDRYSLAQREAAAIRVREALGKQDERISQLESRARQEWQDASSSMREGIQQDIASLRQARLDTAERLGRLEESSASAWKDVKAGFANSYRNLDAAVRKAAARFSDSDTDEAPDDNIEN